MTFKDRLFARLDRAVEALPEGTGVADVVDAEDWVPPHKMAGFSPYDVIITLEAAPEDVDVEDVEELLENNAVPYDRVITVEENDDARYDGKSAAYVSLAAYDE